MAGLAGLIIFGAGIGFGSFATHTFCPFLVHGCPSFISGNGGGGGTFNSAMATSSGGTGGIAFISGGGGGGGNLCFF